MSTNQAFIDAYSSAPKLESRPATPTVPAPMLGSSELVLAGNLESTEAKPEPSVAACHQSSTERRPLSQLRAENAIGLRDVRPKTTGSTKPQWPEVCQQLMARSADKFDAVLRQLPAESPQALVGIMGTSRGCGCSTTAICLALRSSALGYNTLLVDADLSRAGLAPLLKIDQYASWIDLLLAGEAIESALVRGDMSSVDLLLAEQLEGVALDPSVRFRASLSAGNLRRKYHRVVIDFGAAANPTLNSGADLAAALGVDFLIATAAPQTTEAELSGVVDLLGQHGLNLAGIIEAAIE